MELYRQQYNFDGRALEPSGVEDLYKKDADFTAFDIAPPLGGYQGWEAYSVGWRKIMSKYSKITFTIRDDLRVFRVGDVGWVSFSADWGGVTAAGETFNKEFRQTMVWVREADGHWRVVQEHGSCPKTTTLPGGEMI
jgi:ketosteroid isomerase-like protein